MCFLFFLFFFFPLDSLFSALPSTRISVYWISEEGRELRCFNIRCTRNTDLSLVQSILLGAFPRKTIHFPAHEGQPPRVSARAGKRSRTRPELHARSGSRAVPALLSTGSLGTDMMIGSGREAIQSPHGNPHIGCGPSVLRRGVGARATGAGREMSFRGGDEALDGQEGDTGELSIIFLPESQRVSGDHAADERVTAWGCTHTLG